MKHRFPPLLCLLSLTVIAAGCAGERAARRKIDLMVAAGFVPKPAVTAAAREQMDSLTPLRMQRYLKDNQFIYVFPDPKGCDCVYVGNQTQYARYRELAIKQEIAEDQLQSQQWYDSRPPYWGYPYWGYGPGWPGARGWSGSPGWDEERRRAIEDNRDLQERGAH
jgi:hypothetical protein